MRVTRPLERLEQAGCDLRQRTLAAAVEPLQRDYLAGANCERGAAEHLGAVAVRVANGVEADERSAGGAMGAGSSAVLPACVPRPVHGEPGASLGDRRVEQEPPLLHQQHPVRDRERPVDPLLREHDGAAGPLEHLEKRIGALGVELRGGLVEQKQLRPERQRRGKTDALQLAPGQLHRPPAGEVRRTHLVERRLDGGQISLGATPMFSRPKATSFSTRVITTWFSGSWKTEATVPVSSAGPWVRLSSPPISTRPEKRPPWKCGTSPASARNSVDLPLPDGPRSATTSPAWSSSETSSQRRGAAGVGKGEVFDPR